MAMNPMQRKIRNSFLFGFLVAVIVAAVIIGVLFMKIKGLNQKVEETAAQARLNIETVYALAEDVEAKENVQVKQIDVIKQYAPENAITDLSDYMDEEGNFLMVSLCAMEANTILTPELVSNKEAAGSYRTIEYNSILLPSKVMAGEYIDIRLKFVDSVNNLDYIVLSRVLVEDCNSTSIWLKLSDAEQQLLDCAVVESYAVEGSKLYAVQFTNSAQPKLEATYVPTPEVVAFVKVNAQTESDKEIIERFEKDREAGWESEEELSVRDVIGTLIDGQEDPQGTVREGIRAEKTAIRAAREALMGEGY